MKARELKRTMKIVGLFLKSDYLDFNEFMTYFNSLSRKEQKAILR